MCSRAVPLRNSVSVSPQNALRHPQNVRISAEGIPSVAFPPTTFLKQEERKVTQKVTLGAYMGWGIGYFLRWTANREAPV